MDKIARLRQEIERRINILTNVYAEQLERKDEEMMTYYHGKVIALEELRPFLDTLSEEPDKSLEEGAYKYSFDSRPSIYGQVDVIDAFKAGAEWQASQMPMPEDTVLFNKGVAEGRRLEKEDMLKAAEECELSWVGAFLAIDLNMVALGYSEKDKVKVIVLKAEEE